MPLDLEDGKRPKTRWVPFDGHLVGVEILVEFLGTEQRQKFLARLESDGITRPTKDDPMKVNLGRERAFFRAWAKQYVRDWRVAEGFPPETIKPQGAAFDADKMGDVLAQYPRAFELLLNAIGDENAFFDAAPSDSTPS